MYDALNTASGQAAVDQYLTSTYAVVERPDGVEFAQKDKNFSNYDEVSIPNRLRDWLLDLRLLRNIPVAYLVPDAALLPPESIRFFHIDPTWVDRMIEGAFSACQVGTIEANFRYALLSMSREALDADLTERSGGAWTPADGMTGMLIRSELATRWPTMTVEATKGAKKLFVFRQEAISKTLWIAIIGGTPNKVKLIEPGVGVRYGVEPIASQAISDHHFEVDRRTNQGVDVTGQRVNGKFRNLSKRTLDLPQFAGAISLGPAKPRMVGIHLEQRAYAQVFTTAVGEPKGSVPLENFKSGNNYLAIQLRKGRTMTVKALEQRQQVLNQMKEKP